MEQIRPDQKTEAAERKAEASAGEQQGSAVFTICGCRGSFPLGEKRFSEFGGDTSCYVLKRGDYAAVIDCGTGLQRARKLLAGCRRVDVLLTHVHYDHIIGILDFSVFPEDAALTFYGNFNAWLGSRTISEVFRHPFWPVDLSRGTVVSIETERSYQLAEGISAVFYTCAHPDGGTSICLQTAGKKLLFMGDCEDPESLPEEALKNCFIILYDGMYEDLQYASRVGYGHSTWEGGVRLANQVHPEKLIITHHDSSHDDEALRALEVKVAAAYPGAALARAGDSMIL